MKRIIMVWMSDDMLYIERYKIHSTDLFYEIQDTDLLYKIQDADLLINQKLDTFSLKHRLLDNLSNRYLTYWIYYRSPT